ncbi:LuxR C-terminal-related transcriptional regulator [Nocardia asteroides]|uniref:LuxR C-terminal-related transcriptional regulator n=1 Tax=Nocardia asteroides TaxID=1824 RepID=UPI001E425490|nr:LuxR C-terminal-related transcriptional regulator [Nocardia asteroides]UGT60290.1 LuxR C-terminal-related transcriptional regulator [Nocardia asteroides]
MAEPAVTPADLPALRAVIDGPLAEIARRCSRYLAERWPHDALVIFTRECTGRPRKVAGAAEVVDRVGIGELEAVRSALAPGEHAELTARLGEAERRLWAVLDRSGILLVLVPREPARPVRAARATAGRDPVDPAATLPCEADERCALPGAAELAARFGIVATSIRQQVAQASPEYLTEARAASAERSRAVAELTAAHEATLTAVLATLRATGLDDRQARAAAVETASAALLAARAGRATERALAEEPPAAAFDRLRAELAPVLRDTEVLFAAPGAGAPLPGEIAVGARAMTTAVVLAFVGQPGLRRLRVGWEHADAALRIDVRDQESGVIDADALRRALEGRVRTLRAALEIEALPGWGSRVALRLPLAAPAVRRERGALDRLNRREREVLGLLAAGRRNRAIAAELGVAESTVKFHVTGVLKKLAVSTRGEAAALGVRAGLLPGAP